MTDRPLSILQVLTTRAPRYGGPPRMAELCSALGGVGHHVELVSTTVDGPNDLDVPTARFVEEDGFVSIAFPVRRPREYTFSPTFTKWLWLNVQRFDIVHVHSVYRYTTVAAAKICRLRSVPYLLHPHGALTAHHRARHRGRKWAYETAIERPNARHAHTVIWESDREQAEAVAAGWPRGSMIWSGVWLPEVEEATSRRPGEVVFLGRLAEKKGVDVLVEAFAQVAVERPQASLRLIGPDGGLREILARRVAELGVGDRVRFEGVLHGQEKDDALRRASLHVLPSADESFGAAAIEAMAYATPVVVTDGFPFAPEVERDQAGVVVARNPSDLAQGIATLLDDTERARGIGRNGRAFVASRFAWEIIARQFEELYRTTVMSNGCRGRHSREALARPAVLDRRDDLRSTP